MFIDGNVGMSDCRGRLGVSAATKSLLGGAMSKFGGVQ